jgi:hypothetical protein
MSTDSRSINVSPPVTVEGNFSKVMNKILEHVKREWKEGGLRFKLKQFFKEFC